ncbi:MAG TPA: hypothetical protein VFN67_30720 [Polyangiales bacterium]|nr:hypothetical protein [Polyangiales bacterium]
MRAAADAISETPWRSGTGLTLIAHIAESRGGSAAFIDTACCARLPLIAAGG